jgi:hypothetical protein
MLFVKKNKILTNFFIFLLLLIIACGPSEQEIQARIDEAIEEVATTSTSTTSTSTTSTSTTSTSTTLPKYGNWEISRNTSALTDSMTIVANLRSNREVTSKNFSSYPLLQLQCSGGNTQSPGEYKVAIDTGLVLTPYYEGEIGEVAINIRLDKNKAQRLIVREGTNSETVFVTNPETLLGFMANSENMLFEFTPFNSNSDYADFKLNGIEAVLTEMQTSCYHRVVEAGLLAQANNLSNSKWVNATAEFNWGFGSNSEGYLTEMRMGHTGGGKYPLRVLFAGQWNDLDKDRIINHISSEIYPYVNIEITEEYKKYYTDIILWQDKSAAIKFDNNLTDNYLGADGKGWNIWYDDNGTYWERCSLWFDSSKNINSNIFNLCLGNGKWWWTEDYIPEGESLYYSVQFKDELFFENETFELTEIDKAILGLLYWNSFDSLLGYWGGLDAFKQNLSNYDIETP